MATDERCEGCPLLGDCDEEHCPNLDSNCTGCGAKHEVDCECGTKQGFIVFATLDNSESVVWLTHDRSWSDNFMRGPMRKTLYRAHQFISKARGVDLKIGVKSVCVVPAFDHPYTVA